jgi:hypothetical protein
MDQATATIIAALIAAAGSIAVALITVRGRTVERRAPEPPIRTTPKPSTGQSKPAAESEARRAGLAFVNGVLTFIALLGLFSWATTVIAGERTFFGWLAVIAAGGLALNILIRKARHN